jgi:carbon-monoxide dehydrogenase medium subunit
LKPFTYFTPSDCDEAVRLLDQFSPGARLIAGGQTLLLAMKTRSERPRVLVSLAGISDLSVVGTDVSGQLVVGATTTYAALTHAKFSGWHREISAMAGNLADRPVRTMGTIGGALCSGDPSYDMPTLVMGVGARLEILSPAGVRTLTPEEFFGIDGGITIASNEILTSIRFPSKDVFTAVVFEKFRQRTFDAAVVSALCATRIDSDGAVAEARITIGAATPTPTQAIMSARELIGVPVADIDPAAVAVAVSQEVLGDPSADSDLVQYQRELIKALTRKALLRALTTSRS